MEKVNYIDNFINFEIQQEFQRHPWLKKMVEKNKGYGLGTIALILIGVIAVLYLFYYFLKKAKEAVPDMQGIYHVSFGSPQNPYPINLNIDVPADKYHNIAITFSVLILSLLGLGFFSLVETKSTIPIYFTGIMLLLSGCKLCFIDIKELKELISLIKI